eukprot:366099-Chlamydomonas_euryale.AAC.7
MRPIGLQPAAVLRSNRNCRAPGPICPAQKAPALEAPAHLSGTGRPEDCVHLSGTGRPEDCAHLSGTGRPEDCVHLA